MDGRRWELAFKKGPLTDSERKELEELNQPMYDGDVRYREGMTEEEVRAVLARIREEENELDSNQRPDRRVD